MTATSYADHNAHSVLMKRREVPVFKEHQDADNAIVEFNRAVSDLQRLAADNIEREYIKLNKDKLLPSRTGFQLLCSVLELLK